jgi:signal peptide peptidase SppA
MTFLHALLRNEPLLIQPQVLAAFIERCGLREAIEDLFGAAPKPEIQDGVGIIPLSGIIGKGLAPIEKMLGAVDVDEVGGQVEAFAGDPQVHTLLFDLDSPGGTVTGVPELADLVGRQSKPTVAFTSSLACSAAYWIGSQADRLIATPSACVGSVGVYIPFLDSSGAYALRGMAVDIIKAGKFKAAGFPGTSLSEEQRALLQERVNQLHATFKESVRNKRRYVRDGDMEGQEFYGREAADKRLVTGLVSSHQELLAQLTRRTA